MTDLLSLLLKANLAAAAAIVLALLLRKAARRIFGARVAYGLWLIVPLAVVASLLPARSVVLPYAAPLDPVADIAGPATPVAAILTAAPPAPLFDSAALIALWLAGAAISFAALAWSQSRFIKSLGGLAREGEFLRARAGGVGPAVVGALFPRIVLPADFEARYDPAEQQVVLAHEAAHLATGDAAVNALTALARCLFWFNPLIHLAASFVRVDQELACDAAVLSAYPQMRRPYAEALLKTQLVAAPLPLGCYWPAGASNPLKERIAMLTLERPSRVRRLLGGGAVLALCLGAGAATWAAQPARVTVAMESPAAPAARSFVAGSQPMDVKLAQATPRSAPTLTAAAAPAAKPVEMTQSPAGHVFQRVNADPIPARAYLLRVAMPDGTYKTMLSARTPPIIRPGEETAAYRAAVRVYEAALEEQAARGASGRLPQPLTPELQSALDTIENFARDTNAKRFAELDATHERITVSIDHEGAAPTVAVTSPSGGRPTPVPLRAATYLVTRNFTTEAKASNLAALDARIAASPPQMRDLLVKIREVVAQKPTTD